MRTVLSVGGVLLVCAGLLFAIGHHVTADRTDRCRLG